MDQARFYDEIVDLLLNIPSGYEARIRQFSNAVCSDYSMPLHLIHSFLMKAEDTPEAVRDLNRFRGSGELDAIRDIARVAPLNRYLLFDIERAQLSFLGEIEYKERRNLSRYLAARTGGIA